jgi:hypothetical protein
MTGRPVIPGADELVGKGVYLGLPHQIPRPVRDRHAVVVGEGAELAAAARQWGEAGWTITLVSRGRPGGSGVRRECRRRPGTEVACAAGGEYLEVVVLRHLHTGRIDACNASALLVL